MPIVKVDLFKGKTRDQKREIAEALTDAMVEKAGSNRAAVWVVFNDVEKEDWAFGGELGVDKFPDKA